MLNIQGILTKENIVKSLPFLIFTIFALLIIISNKPFWEDEALYALSALELFGNVSLFPLLNESVQNVAFTKLLLLPHFFIVRLFGTHEYVFRILSFFAGFCTLFLARRILKIMYGQVNLVFLISLAVFPPFILASTENISIIWFLFFSILFFYLYLQFYRKKLTFKKFLLSAVILGFISPFLATIFSFFFLFRFILELREKGFTKHSREVQLFFTMVGVMGILTVSAILYDQFIDSSPETFKEYASLFIGPILGIPAHFVRIFEIFISYFSYYLYLPLFLVPLIFFRIKDKNYQLLIILFLSTFFSLLLVATFLDGFGSFPTRGMVLLSFLYLLLIQPILKTKVLFGFAFVLLILFIIHLVPFFTPYVFYIKDNNLQLKGIDEIKYENVKWLYDDSNKRAKISLEKELECISLDMNEEPSRVNITYFDISHFGDFEIPSNYSWRDGILYLAFEIPFKELSNHTLFIYLLSGEPVDSASQEIDYIKCTSIESFEIQTRPSRFENFVNEKIFMFKTHPLFHEDFDWRSLSDFLNTSIKERGIVGNNIEFYASLPAPLIFYMDDYNFADPNDFRNLHPNVQWPFSINVGEILSENWYGERWFIADNMRYWSLLRENERKVLEEKCEKLFFPEFLIYRCIYSLDADGVAEFGNFSSAEKTVLDTKAIQEDFDWRSLSDFLNTSIKERGIVGNNIEFYASLPVPLIFYMDDYNLTDANDFYDLHLKGQWPFSINVEEILSENWHGERWFVADNAGYWFRLRENERKVLEEKCERLFFLKFLIYRCIYSLDADGVAKFRSFLFAEKTVLDTKPILQNYIPNADLLYPFTGTLVTEELSSSIMINRPNINDTKGWKGIALIEMGEALSERKGLAIIHPISPDEPSFIETPEFILPEDGFVAIGFRNVAGFLSYAESCEYTDNIFLVNIIKDNVIFRLDDFVLTMEEGWKDVVYSLGNLQNLHGSKVKIRVEGWAGGKMPWCGEWAAVDYIDIIDFE